MTDTTRIGVNIMDFEGDLEAVERYAIFVFFNNNPGRGEHYLQLVVYRDEDTGKVAYHEFEYLHYDGVSADPESAASADDAADLLPTLWEDAGRIAASMFMADEFERLARGEIEFDEVYE